MEVALSTEPVHKRQAFSHRSHTLPCQRTVGERVGGSLPMKRCHRVCRQSHLPLKSMNFGICPITGALPQSALKALLRSAAVHNRVGNQRFRNVVICSSVSLALPQLASVCHPRSLRCYPHRAWGNTSVEMTTQLRHGRFITCIQLAILIRQLVFSLNLFRAVIGCGPPEASSVARC